MGGRIFLFIMGVQFFHIRTFIIHVYTFLNAIFPETTVSYPKIPAGTEATLP